MEHADVVVVGAGAAGLMAATWCGRTHPGRRIVVLEGARSLGAKILVAGGGRCNVTHDTVSEADFSGSSPPAIRNVLRRFGVERTVEFFRELGVELKREDTGKLFPVTDRARTILDALLRSTREAGAEVRFPRRVERLRRNDEAFELSGEWGAIRASTIILCAGGSALPKSGSDGAGHVMARSLGHSVTPLVVPALVPLVLDASCRLRELPGVACEAVVEVRSGSGKRLARFRDALLCTHFGVSGPAILDVSRHLTHARASDPSASLVVSWLPGETPESVDRQLLALGKGPARFLARRMPERLARTLCEMAGGDPHAPASAWTRTQRRALAGLVTEMLLPVAGDRGWTHAEVTAGGVPLSEIRLQTMESRLCPRAHLAGEVLDVDGRIGGYNFQWAWASGHVAGVSA